jgi:phage portal protein BeeE
MGLIDNARSLLGLPARNAVIPYPLGGIDNFWPYANLVGGGTYPLNLSFSTQPTKTEEVGRDFGSLVANAYKANSVVFACMLARMMIFSEARFQFQQMRKGRPGDLFGDPSLDILEHPWTGATTGDLLTQMIVDADLAGNAYLTRRGGQIVRMRPDWVSIVVGSFSDAAVDSWDLDAQVLGYVYYPGGEHSGRDGIPLQRSQVAHFRPIADPAARYKGMSWLSPIVREVMADQAATTHKLMLFENGATPQMIVKRNDSVSPDVFRTWVALMREGREGVANAYKTFWLDSGADATVVGKDLQQMEFKVTQGAGETRIAAAAGVHPVVVGLSEGMQGSSLNAGNFNSARRLVADRTMRPLWRNAAGSLEMLVPPPPGARLWYDTRDVAFLLEDRKDAAEIQQIKAASIRQLVDAGYKADTVVKAVEAEDMTMLEHSGLFSVQLQPPGTLAPNGTAPVEAAPPKPTNGTKPKAPAKA